MPPRSAAKKSSASVKSTTTAAERRTAAQEKRAAQQAAEQLALTEWIDTHDPLLDRAADNPIRLEELFSTKLVHRTFAKPGIGEQPYDWSEFKTVLENRTAQSPRWFIQLREEDLLAGADGLEGVTVDCYVVVEASVPTLAPSEYVVKVHWPYSDAEDNAPERILPLDGQQMCWRRVVKTDGSDINVFLLQKRTAASAGTANGMAASLNGPSGTAAPAMSFGFGGSPAASASPPASSASTGFGFGFGTTTMPSVTTTTAASFGFGGDPVVKSTALVFGFGSGSAATTTAAVGAAVASPPSFSFGSAVPASTGAASVTNSAVETGAVRVEPLKTSEILFPLWSKKRLTEMAKEIRSGSRVVREGFVLDASTSIKLVMQNDRKDEVGATVRRLLLNRLFAKQDDDVKAVDKWIDDCPVYDEVLAAALQGFRERHLQETADDSDLFQGLCQSYQEKMEVELQRIVDVRTKAAEAELDQIEEITTKLKERKLAEKSSFRLLKYYAKNDVQHFRPFGKISGISEMGESVDVCVPPAHVNINPFTGKPL